MPSLDFWTTAATHIAVIIVLAVLARWLVQVLIRRMVTLAGDRTREHLEKLGRTGKLLAASSDPRQKNRAQAMGSLLGSAATFVIASIAIVTILADVGINLQPLIASAGVTGVALAFGAQSLVKDMISGIFLIVEDQFGVGDTIQVNDVHGTVEHVGLRVTSVRDGNGMLWHLRNGEITKLGNVSQGWSMATVDLPVAPTEDAQRAIAVLERVCAQMGADEDFSDDLIEAPEVLGVESVTGSAITLRLSAKCAPNQQWGVSRELRERAKQALDAAGVRPALGWPSGPTQ